MCGAAAHWGAGSAMAALPMARTTSSHVRCLRTQRLREGHVTMTHLAAVQWRSSASSQTGNLFPFTNGSTEGARPACHVSGAGRGGAQAP